MTDKNQELLQISATPVQNRGVLRFDTNTAKQKLLTNSF